MPQPKIVPTVLLIPLALVVVLGPAQAADPDPAPVAPPPLSGGRRGRAVPPAPRPRPQAPAKVATEYDAYRQAVRTARADKKPLLVWVGLNREGFEDDQIQKSVNVTISDTPEHLQWLGLASAPAVVVYRVRNGRLGLSRTIYGPADIEAIHDGIAPPADQASQGPEPARISALGLPLVPALEGPPWWGDQPIIGSIGD